MRKITSNQFKTEIELDPAWASRLTEPVEITDYCWMDSSGITHLSPLLHFTGRGREGRCANFSNCNSLKVAEGKFEGFVSFSYSSIERIGDLSCGKDNAGNSAYFYNCKSLKVAKGKFEGFVSFWDSGVERIEALSCGKNNDGVSASFLDCKYLEIAEGNFEGYVSFYDSSIRRIEGLSCKEGNDGFRLNVENCPNLESIPIIFNPKGIKADLKLIKNLTETRAFIQKKRTEIIEIEL